MGEIHKLTKDGVTLYPATTTDAVVHPQTKNTLSNMITDYNVSVLFPNDGSGNTSKYTLQGAISVLSKKLNKENQVPGIKIIFDEITSGVTQEWRYLGGTIANTSNWSREDSWYVTVSEDIEDLEDNFLIGDLLRKSEQNLSNDEKTQVKKNLGIQLDAKIINWNETTNLNDYKTTGIYIINDGFIYENQNNIPVSETNLLFSAILTVTASPSSIGQEILITDSKTLKSLKYTRCFDNSTSSWTYWYKLESIVDLGEIDFNIIDELKNSGSFNGYINNFPGKESKSKFRLDIIRSSENSISQTIYFSDSNPQIRYFKNNNWTNFLEVITENTIKDLQEAVKGFEEHLTILELEGRRKDFCVASWDPNDLKPECDEIYGDLEFCNDWNFYLLDTSDNTGETTTPVGKLMKNNLLRFEDGSFAPTVGITEERRKECDVELFLEDGYQVCASNEFDPVDFYEKYGVNTKLYNKSGQEVNILRPWETTEKKYTIGIGRDKTIYLLDNILGNSGKKWKGIFSKPVIWDGIDVSNFEIKPTAISPCACTVVVTEGDNNLQEKSRNFFYLYTTAESCMGSMGVENKVGAFYNNRSYPINNISPNFSINYSRLNNGNNARTVPFAECGYLVYNSFVTSYEIYHKTKYLLDYLKFSGGICHETVNNEEDWKIKGGIQISSDEKIFYQSWGGNIQDIGLFLHDVIYTDSTWSNIVNKHAPKGVCMESQMALSFANELNIAEDTEFDFYGNIFWYKNVLNYENKSDGLNARVYKKVTDKITLYDTNDNPTEFNIDIILRTGLINGTNYTGDVFLICNGGYELVGTNNKTTKPSDGGGYPIKIYLEPDPSKWVYDTGYCKNNYGTFNFEDTYKLLVEEQLNLPDEGYVTERIPYTNFPTKYGGLNYNGECCFCWESNNWGYTTEGDRYRIGNIIGYDCIHNLKGLRSGYHYYNTNKQGENYSILQQARINTEHYLLN